MTPDGPELTNFVLLVNAKVEKGFGLILDVAALRPEISFVCINSQSESAEAANAVKHHGLSNVHVIPRTDEMAALYRAARVVAVPSYQFVETFSRVCIEGHRFGKPVIGSTVGNVPLLLERSGIVLPEDAAIWAAELGRLFEDEAYYAAASAAAYENSRTYSYASQRDAILSVARQALSPMLVAVGSGIGNMIHVSPTIRRLALHLGAPVDLLVAQDHSESLFLLHNCKYVNAVYSLRQYAIARRYDTIFVTNSFGGARLPLKAGRVLWSRDWDLFHPNHSLHEALFNLEAAKQLLGVDYSLQEASDPYVGEFQYTWRAGTLVGIHGGSKEGFWRSKRWPYYSQLVEQLTQKGYRVASFGTPDEYVEGAEDMTGGSIQQMTDAMRACSYFISNDSGVINLANALGIPLIALFAPTNSRTRGPLRPTSRSISLVKDCSPCEYMNTPLFLSAQCRCIGEIPLHQVTEAFDQLAASMTSAEPRATLAVLTSAD